MRGRVVGAVVAALLLGLVLVGVGRWERSHHAEQENDGIERVYRSVGNLDAPTLQGFRFLDDFQCLIYRGGGRTFGLELCVDWQGRVIEGIDRRGDEVQISSLREDPGRARVHVDRRRFERVIETMCKECRAIFDRARMPLGQAGR